MKVKVPVYGTIGKAVVVDLNAGAQIGLNLRGPDGRVLTVAELRALLGLNGGVIRHRDLQGLQTGDDHPQYTMWNAVEQIRQPWSWRIGGVEQWSINDSRVLQSVPHVVQQTIDDTATEYPMLQLVGRHTSSGAVGGIQFSIENVSSPSDGDLGAQFGMWEGTLTAPGDIVQFPPDVVGSGYRWRMEGSQAAAADLVFRTHESSATGVEVYRHRRDRAQMLFASGSASLPTIAFSSSDTTGVTLVGAGQLGLVASGSIIFRIDSSFINLGAQLRAVGGTAGSPGYSFATGTDTNTGAYRVAEDQYGISTGGSLRTVTTNSAFRLPTDNYELQIGAGNDLRLVHDGTHSYIDNDTGNLNVTSAADLNLLPTGEVNLPADDLELRIGAANDLRLFHDGTNSHIHNDTGNLVITVGGELDLEEVTTSTGANTPTLGTNKPGSAVSLTPTTWMTTIVNGTTYYIPLWE